MESQVADALALLSSIDVELSPGLSDDEIASIEGKFGFRFSVIQRQLLRQAVPVDRVGDPPRWPRWRGASDDLIRQLQWPLDGVAFDVVENDFWLPNWGPRPEANGVAEHIAREQLQHLPPMVPLYGHRYFPSQPCAASPPVFSIYETDVIYYGDNLLDYLHHEFSVGTAHPEDVTWKRRVPFWSDLAEDTVD